MSSHLTLPYRITALDRDRKPHREGKSAEEYLDGTVKWYLNGKQHRVDGPAITREDGGTD